MTVPILNNELCGEAGCGDTRRPLFMRLLMKKPLISFISGNKKAAETFPWLANLRRRGIGVAAI